MNDLFVLRNELRRLCGLLSVDEIMSNPLVAQIIARIDQLLRGVAV